MPRPAQARTHAGMRHRHLSSWRSLATAVAVAAAITASSVMAVAPDTAPTNQTGNADRTVVWSPLTIWSAVVAFAMAWSIGAQDVSNALGTSVGSRAVTVKQAIIMAGICEFAGSMLGGEVAATIASGILKGDAFSAHSDPVAGAALYAWCMFCTIFGACLWLGIATFWSLPVSTTHSLVGALVGVGFLALSIDGVQWGNVFGLVSSWISSPILGGILSSAVFYSIKTLILTSASPATAARTWSPVYAGATVSLLFTFLATAGPKGYRLSPGLALLFALVIALVSAVVWSCLLDQNLFASHRLHAQSDGEAAPTEDMEAGGSEHIPEVTEAENMFKPLMVLTACVVAFAHGSNDVSNSIGPFAAIVRLEAMHRIDTHGAPIPAWLLIAGGVGIIIGLATYGHRVMATVGTKITRLTFSRGFSAQIGTAATVLFATVVGMSISTTQCIIGSIAGVALVEGSQNLNLATLKRIVVSWLVTIPAAATLSMLIYLVGSAGSGTAWRSTAGLATLSTSSASAIQR